MYCAKCNRKLKDKKSVDRGYGPVCWSKKLKADAEFERNQVTIDEVMGVELMELGQQVKFSKSLSRQRGYGVNYEFMTDEQRRSLEDNDYINLVRYKLRQHNEKQGFICGKRDIVTAALLQEVEDPYRGLHLMQTHEKWETVYVVACDMRGLYRVRKEDLEVEGNA
ncbi:DUF6011 domain-containing protein [Virgibacillus halodenitrificans]|uniref:DUF6011 domain-containing protein n=1 Tax=Virgibacillus halodenitrificans TaxID=1482 RepID=UPI000EF48013|nr:DUF6011 domain-containing protein [Virgibacillus halodenitrificans]